MKTEYRLLTPGDELTYTKHYKFGKTGQVTAKVVMIKGQTALLDNGDTTSKYTLRPLFIYDKNGKIKSDPSNLSAEYWVEVPNKLTGAK